MASPALMGGAHLRPHHRLRRSVNRSPRVCVRASDLPGVRPYTVRKGDTFDSVAQKRGITANELLRLNKRVHTGQLKTGETILIPTLVFSERDREILKGIRTVGPRTYPLRKGENVADVAKARGVSMDEVAALNKGLNLKSKHQGEILLPNGKYTQREKEMLSSVIPMEATGIRTIQLSPQQIGIGMGTLVVLGAYTFYVRACQMWSRDNE
mmetsp:Transcript_18534/g.60381  ORF Transcript_18534/g.60381 Transcript_18534/m.60381 type:complete len:211 (+) Transcript_18534:13-645(+)